jgi:2-succinyl-5-enolpyruvyl-6-hydroxy-3-cyclohexene-1-carboxylate synthase
MPVGADGGIIVGLAKKLGWPLLADVTSGLRFDDRWSEPVLAHFDLFLRSDIISSGRQPDLVLQLGGPLVSRTLQQYLEAGGARLVLVADHPRRQDPGYIARERIEADPIRFAASLSGLVERNESGLCEPFTVAERAAAVAVRKQFKDNRAISEAALAYWIADLTPPDSGLFLASSMPIRDMEAVSGCRAKRLQVAANRGANGIDGTLATASGFARGLARATTVVLGDLALLHDLNSLYLVKHCPSPVAVVVINNDGGGIFSFLPVYRIADHFERYFAAPHGLSFRAAAELFELPYCQAGDASEFRSVYSKAVVSGQSSLTEVRTDRRENLAEHQDLWSRVSASVRERLKSDY